MQCHRLCAGTNCVHVSTLTECADSNFGRRRGNNNFLAADGIEPGPVWLRLTSRSAKRQQRNCCCCCAGARDVIFPCRTPDFIFPTYFSLSAGEERRAKLLFCCTHISRLLRPRSQCLARTFGASPPRGHQSRHPIMRHGRFSISHACLKFLFAARAAACTQYSAARMSSSGPQNFP